MFTGGLGRRERARSLAAALVGRADSGRRAAIIPFDCLTGDAQTAIVWLRLHQVTGDAGFLEGARRLNRFVASTQDLAAGDPGVRGGIKGSHPIWAEYAPYEYPNWAGKFFVDALMLELGSGREAGT